MIAKRVTERPLAITFPEPAVVDDGLQSSMRSFGVTARVIRIGNGVVLEGVSSTFYGKQMAQELVRKAKLIVVANRIRVDTGSRVSGQIGSGLLKVVC